MDRLLLGQNYEIAAEERHLPNELERVKTFQTVLEGMIEVQPVNTSMDLHAPDPVSDKISQRLLGSHTLKHTLDIDPNFLTQNMGGKINFEPLQSRGGKRSMHGVFFGNLIFEGGVRNIPVAVKPFVDTGHEKDSLKEYFNNVAANRLGLSSIMPVGFILNEQGQSYSITRLEESLTTLDTIDWADFYPNTFKDPGMREDWSQTARLLSQLHSLGSCNHGDLAGRNIALTADDSGVMLIDWERAHISINPPRDAKVRYGLSQEDLSSLIESMSRPAHIDFKAGLGIFYGKSGDWWEAFDEIFFKEYSGMRLDYASIGNHKGAVLTQVKEELSVLEQSLKETMKMQREICDQIPQPLDR